MWRLLNYDPNSLKVARLVNEAEARRRRLGPERLLYNPLVSRRNISQRSCKHSIKIVKIVADWCL
jgi:hypothetical protein